MGQYIRGEVLLRKNQSIYELVEKGFIDRKILQRMLLHLNHCIVAAVSMDLWNIIRGEIEFTIGIIIQGQFEQELALQERIRRLRSSSIKNGEDFEQEFEKIVDSKEILRCCEELFAKTDLWYVEAALHDFSFDEFVQDIFTYLH